MVTLMNYPIMGNMNMIYGKGLKMNIDNGNVLIRRFEDYMQKRDPFFRNVNRMINGIYCVKATQHKWDQWLKKENK